MGVDPRRACCWPARHREDADGEGGRQRDERELHLGQGPQLLSKWVGESEKAIRQTFRKARQVSPTIIFFDELDSLAPSRGQEMGNNVSERVVNQLLTELDGLEEMGDVMVIGATNRPDMIDPALLRSGRFDRLVMIGQPDQEGRERILEIHTQDTPLAPDVTLREIAEITDGYVGSDLEGIAREAAIEALRDDDDAEEVEMKHFRRALESVRPTINDDILAYYEEVEEQFKGAAAATRSATPAARSGSNNALRVLTANHVPRLLTPTSTNNGYVPAARPGRRREHARAALRADDGGRRAGSGDA